MFRFAFFVAVSLLSSCAMAGSETGTVAASPLEVGQKEAVFAGGCFWCMEKPFEHYEGVLEVTSGYTGGPETSPTYRQVGGHQTGHWEAIRVVYDPKRITYDALLSSFWHNIDPTDGSGQFCDKGHQYSTAVFTSDPGEKALAEASKVKVAERLGRKVVTDVLDASVFWVAEAYHQDYYKKNPTHYNRYRTGCGRDARLQQLWGADAGQ
jgi:peptide-methionine (S)-S-oxide reductase